MPGNAFAAQPGLVVNPLFPLLAEEENDEDLAYLAEDEYCEDAESSSESVENTDPATGCLDQISEYVAAILDAHNELLAVDRESTHLQTELEETTTPLPIREMLAVNAEKREKLLQDMAAMESVLKDLRARWVSLRSVADAAAVASASHGDDDSWE